MFPDCCLIGDCSRRQARLGTRDPPSLQVHGATSHEYCVIRSLHEEISARCPFRVGRRNTSVFSSETLGHAPTSPISGCTSPATVDHETRTQLRHICRITRASRARVLCAPRQRPVLSRLPHHLASRSRLLTSFPAFPAFSAFPAFNSACLNPAIDFTVTPSCGKHSFLFSPPYLLW